MMVKYNINKKVKNMQSGMDMIMLCWGITGKNINDMQSGMDMIILCWGITGINK